MPLPHEVLATELDALGLTDMAKKAREFYYHDFKSPLDFPELQLLRDLADAGKSTGDNTELRDKILALRERHKAGEFDATTDESDEWAKSPEGQEAFSRLMPRIKT